MFLSVAQNGSISKAAEEQRYVQPNVTARIKLLEEQLNSTLSHLKSKGTTSGYMLRHSSITGIIEEDQSCRQFKTLSANYES